MLAHVIDVIDVACDAFTILVVVVWGTAWLLYTAYQQYHAGPRD